LTVVYPGTETQTPTDAGWAVETALDVEWVHAIAPAANILLVSAVDSGSGLLDAITYANTHGANVVSMSWGSSEFLGENILDTTYFNTTGVTYLASSGTAVRALVGPRYRPM